MSTPHPPEFRPYRVAMYVLFLAFTAAFIGLVARSVWRDVYRDSAGGPGAGASPAVCVEELDRLFRHLESRSTEKMSAREAQNWDAFNREFEDRLHALSTDCSNHDGWPPEVADAITTIAEKLESLRGHYSRCGAEGESTRTGIANGLKAAKAALKP